MRFALFGIFGVDNFGNEASLGAMLWQVKRRLPHAEVFCICPNPLKVTIDHRIEAIAMREQIPDYGKALPSRFMKLIWRVAYRLLLSPASSGFRAFRHMRDVDLFIIPGTGVLDDFGTGPWGLPYDLLIWCTVARLRGAMVVFSNIGAGPIKRPLSRWFMKRATQLAHYRSFRDDISKVYMQSLGVNVSIDDVLPDLVFSLNTTNVQQSPKLSNDRIIVSVGVMAYYGWENNAEKGHRIYEAYISKISQFIKWLLKGGYAVQIVIGESTDKQAVENIMSCVSKLTENHLCEITANPIAKFNDLLKEMSFADVVVATRYHNIICALMLEKPVISLGYAKKNQVLLKGMELDKYCQHIERFDVDILITHFKEVLQNLAYFKKRIHDETEKYRKLLDTQFTDLFETFQ